MFNYYLTASELKSVYEKFDNTNEEQNPNIQEVFYYKLEKNYEDRLLYNT